MYVFMPVFVHAFGCSCLHVSSVFILACLYVHVKIRMCYRGVRKVAEERLDSQSTFMSREVIFLLITTSKPGLGLTPSSVQ